MKQVKRRFIPNLVTFLLLFFAVFSYGQDVGITKVEVVDATETNTDEYSFCPSDSISLNITLTNFGNTPDNVDNISILITGVNSETLFTTTISSTITLTASGTAGSSSTIVFPDDFTISPTLEFNNFGISTIAVSSTSVSGTGDVDTDNDVHRTTAIVYTPDSPTLSVTPASATACQGEEIYFQINTGGSSATLYKFYVQGALEQQSATDNTITFSTDPSDPNALSDGDVVTIEVIDANGCETDTSMVSQTVRINNLPDPSLTNDGTNNTICDGDTIEFTATGGTEYEFYVGASLEQARSVSNTFIPAGIANGQEVKVVVYNADGCSAEETNTIEVIELIDPGSIVLSTATDSLVCYGEAMSGNVSSTSLASSTHSITYSWESSPNGTDWQPYGTSTSTSITPTLFFSDKYFRRVASAYNSDLDCTTNGYTAPVFIEVNPEFALSLSTNQTSYCLNQNIVVSASAGAATYTFFVNGEEVQSSPNRIYAATASTSTSTPTNDVSNNDVISVTVIDSSGCSYTSSTTIVAPTIGLNPSMTTNPIGNVICEGEEIVITASGGVSYTFAVNGNPPAFGEVVGNVFTTSTLSGTNEIALTAFNNYGCSETTTMTIDVIRVISAGTITYTTASDAILCYGANPDPIISTAEATSTHSITYVWEAKVDGGDWTPVASATDTSTFDPEQLTVKTSYRRLAYAYIDTNADGIANDGTTCSDYEESNTITFNVNPQYDPGLVTGSGSTQFCENDPITFSVAAASGSVTYTFTIAGDAARQQVGTSRTFITTTGTGGGLEVDNGEVVSILVEDGNGCTYTESITIQVDNFVSLGLISLNSDKSIICSGDSILLTAGPTGAGYRYTFSSGGTDIVTNSPTPTLTVPNITEEQEFTLEVINANGCSDLVSITILVPQIDAGGQISTTASLTVCLGDGINADIIGDGSLAGSSSATLDGDSSTASITYLWQQKVGTASWTNIQNGGVDVTTTNLVSTVLLTFTEDTSIRRVAFATRGSVECPSSPADYIISNLIRFTVENATPVSFTSSTGGYSYCEEETNIQFTAVGGYLASQYNWTLGTVTATGLSLTVDASDFADGETLELYAVTSAGCTSTIARQVLSKTAAPNFVITTDQPGNTVCSGDPITITASTTVVLAGTTTYTFTLNGGAPIVSNTPSISTNVTGHTSITIVVENNAGCTDTQTSVIFVPKLDPTDGGTISTTASLTVCFGERLNADIIGDGSLAGSSSATLDGDSSTASITYLWQQKVGTASWTNIQNGGVDVTTTNLVSTVLLTFTEDTSIRRVAFATRGSVECPSSPADYIISNLIRFTVENATPVSFTSSTGGYSYCEEETNIQFTAVGGYLASQYNWTLGTVTATGLSLTVDASDFADGETLELYAVTSAGCTSTIARQVLSKTAAPNFVITTDQPGNTVCSGDPITITASTTVVLAGTTTYTFTLNGGAPIVSNTPSISTNVTGHTSITIVVENNAGCTDTQTSVIFVPKLDPTDGGTISTTASLTVCFGERLNADIIGDGSLAGSSSATLDGDSSTASITYLWQQKVGTASWTNIQNGGVDVTTTNLVSTVLLTFTEDTSIRRVAFATRGSVECPSSPADYIISNLIRFTVENATPVSFTSSTGGYSYCEEETNIQFTAVGGYLASQYNWTLGTVTATGLSLTVDASDFADGETLELYAVTSAGCTSTIARQVLSKTAAPNFVITTDQPGNTVCSGDPITITASTTVVLAGTTTYTFTLNGGAPIVSNTPSISTNVTGHTSITIVVENNAGCTDTQTSVIFVPKLDPTDGGTISTTASLTVCFGERLNADIIGDGSLAGSSSATLDGDSSTASITYLWQQKVGTASWTNIQNGGVDVTTTNLVSTVLLTFTEDTSIRRVAFATRGSVECPSSPADYIISNLIEVRISDVSVDPIIDSSTGSFAFCNDATLVEFNAIGPYAESEYRWELAAETQTGSDTFAVDINDFVDGDFVRLYAVTSDGCTTTIVQQQLTKNDPPSFFIRTDKSGDAICPNELITITASNTTALAGTTTYTYYLGGTQIAQSNTPSISTTSITVDTLVRIEVESSAGCSATETLTILVPELSSTGSITLSDPTDSLICKGGDPSIINGDNTGSSRVASVTSALATVTYQWFYKTNAMADFQPTGVGPLHTGENYNPGALNQTTTFRRKAYARIGSSFCDEEFSNPIEIRVEDERIPQIRVGGIPITAITVCEDEDVTFTADGFVGTDSYTWYIGASVVATQTVNYQVSAGTFNTGDNLKLVIETATGCATETIVAVTVPPVPTLNLTSNAPVAHVICLDENITFSVDDVVGAQYFWSKYSTTTPTLNPLAGSPTMSNSITISTNDLADGDIITVTVSYTAACSVTDSLTVNIIDLDPGSLDMTNHPQTVCGTETPLDITNSVSATTTTGTIEYVWEYSLTGGAPWIPIAGTDSTTFEFGGAIAETRYYRRVAIAKYAGVELCRDTTPVDYQVIVTDIEGGTLTVDSSFLCFEIGAAAPEITVTGASLGDYQWQVATATFDWQDIPGAENQSYTPPALTSTETLFYRRITSNPLGTCSDTTDVYTLEINDIAPGTLSVSPSAVYCNGEQPLELGVGTSTNGTSEFGLVSYTWEYKIDGEPGGYITIDGANGRNYQPPPLFAIKDPINFDETTRYLYRRVTYDASGSGCVAISNVVTITIAPEIEPGDLTANVVNPLNYYICEGDTPADLILLNATAPQASVVTYTWEQSEDGNTWTEVISATSNRNLSFGSSNTPTQTTFYRVKITSGSTAGVPSPSSNLISPSLNIRLKETTVPVTYGEIYGISIDGAYIQVETSATLSTTDQIGTELTATINDPLNGIPGYNAVYYADENLIVFDAYSSNVGITTTPSPTTLFLDMQILSRGSSDDFCTVYSNVYRLVVNESFEIKQVSGPANSQIVCVDNPIDPPTFEIEGEYDYVEIRNLDTVYDITAIGTGSATYDAVNRVWTVSETTQFTITGTPTTLADSSLFIQIRGFGPCDDENLEDVTMTYSIEVNDGPETPDIIYRNNPHRSRPLDQRFKIFQHDGDWFNNTICQDDPDVDPDNPEVTYSFAACYQNNTNLRSVRFDWNVSPTAAVKSMTFMNDGDTAMQAIVNVTNQANVTSFTNGFDYIFTVTGPDGVTTDSFTYSTPTPTLNYNDLVDDLRTDLNANLNWTRVDRSGNDLIFTADTAGTDGYFALQVQNAVGGQFVIENLQYLYPTQNNAVNIVFNPFFGTTTVTTDGVTATLRVRAESLYCDDTFSDWYEVELYVVSEQDPATVLPDLREPDPLPTIDSGINWYCDGGQNGIAGFFDANSDEVPDCELDLNFNDLYTTFYSASVSGSANNYSYLQWEIRNYDGLDSGVLTPGQDFQWNGGIDPEYGTIRWSPGFYGQFDVCVRAVDCAGDWDVNNDDVNEDDEGWVCTTYTIGPQSDLPDIYAAGLPVCPIQTAGTVTSVFTSDQLVDWSIEPRAVRNAASTATRTIDGKIAYEVGWPTGYTHAVIVATSQTCSSDPRYLTVRIPEAARITRQATTVMPQEICQGVDITPMLFDVSGYSVLGIDTTSLPEGLTASFTTQTQTATIRITERDLGWDDSDNRYVISVDYTDFIYEADNTETIAQIATALANLIQGSSKIATATAVTSANSSTITIVGQNAGERFNISTNTPFRSKWRIGQPNIENFNGVLSISGNISDTLTPSDDSFFAYVGSGPTQVHTFVVSTTTASDSCAIGYTMIFHYNPKDKIETTTPTLLSQEVCDGEAIQAIDFQLTQGAYDYNQPEWYPAKPNGIEFDPEYGDVLGQISFTLSGTINTRVPSPTSRLTTTTVYYYTLTTTSTVGCETDSISGTIIVHPQERLERWGSWQQTTTLCTTTDTYTLQYRFTGIRPPTITSTSTFISLEGLSASVSYTTQSPSVELTVVATATLANEVYRVEIVEPDGTFNGYSYTAPLGTESTTLIAEELARAIDANPQLIARSTSETITIEAVNPDYIFWVRINPFIDGVIQPGLVETYRERRMLVTDAIPVQGIFTISGTPSLTLTETATYTLTIETRGDRCSASIETISLIINPLQEITLTSTDTSQEVCQGEGLEDIEFRITGPVITYDLEWGTGIPTGLTFSPTVAFFPFAGTETLTLTGTPTTNNTTTTVYYYTLTTVPIALGACESDSISGTIVIHPEEKLTLRTGTESVSLCSLTETYTLSYDFEGIQAPTITSTSTFNQLIGLSTSVSYTTATPSVKLTVVASATQLNEGYRVEIVEPDGDVTAYQYIAPLGTESITHIADQLALAIDSSPILTASSTGADITIEANNPGYVFWVRINPVDKDGNAISGAVETYRERRMLVTDAIPVKGTFTISGILSMTLSEAATYSITLSTLGDSCTADTRTVTLTIKPAQSISLTSTSTAQEVCENLSIDDITFMLGGGATGYELEWGTAIPAGLTFSPTVALFPFAGTDTLTLSGRPTTNIATTTVYYYTLTTSSTNLDACRTDSISGTIVVHPEEEIRRVLGGPIETRCASDSIELQFGFTGVGGLTFTATPSILSLGLSSTITYSSTPSVELTVLASATAADEIYQVEIVKEDGSVETYQYVALAGTESISFIASQLANQINSSTQLTASSTGATIDVQAVNPNLVFWIRINPYDYHSKTIRSGEVETYRERRMIVTGATPVDGILTISGVPVTTITQTTSYTISISTPGLNCTSSTISTDIVYNPQHIISLTSSDSTLNQTLCDNTSIATVTFQLTGGATGIAGLVWTERTPMGILQPTVDASNTLRLVGTIDSGGVTQTTVYPYSISTTGNLCAPIATITGTITVEPNHYITRVSDLASLSQTVCDGSSISSVTFELSGGARGYNISWSPSNPGLNFVQSATNSYVFSLVGNMNSNVTSTTTYSYTITTSGNACDVNDVSLSGEFTIIPRLRIQVDTPEIRNQINGNAICTGDDINDIEFSFASGTPNRVEIAWYDSSGNLLAPADEPGPILSTIVPQSQYEISGNIAVNPTAATTYRYIVTAISDTSTTCTFTDSFTGSIEVAPRPTADQDYIQQNDVTDVSCNGLSDGSIIIPTTPQGDFDLRIQGGQIAVSQVDRYSFVASATLNQGDVIQVIINDITFSSVVTSDTATRTILEGLEDRVNFGPDASQVAVNADVLESGGEIFLQLTSEVAGRSFTTTGTMVTTVTNTITIVTSTPNQFVNYGYEWTNESGAIVGTSLSLENQPAGEYYLSLSVNGCAATTSYTFTIEEPSISIGAVSETCNRSISVPIEVNLTPSQLAVASDDDITAILYQQDVSNDYTIQVGRQDFSITSSSSETITATFAGLRHGIIYRLKVSDNTCNGTTDLDIGPLSADLDINETLITTTAEECAGEGGTISVANNAISGGTNYYAYEWTNLTNGNTFNTKDVTGASPGLYELTVTDQNLGCDVTTVGVIEVDGIDNPVNLTPAADNITINTCSDGRLGQLEVVVTGGSGTFSYRWEFSPASASQTIEITNNSAELIPDATLPSGYSSTGNYTVYVYDGLLADDCASGSQDFTITGPSPVTLIENGGITQTNVSCAGESTGSIQIQVTGGTPPYLYTITGGIPSISNATGVITEQGLAAGTYSVIVKDSSPDSCGAANQISQDVIITEPAGGPLELSEGTINEIPCSGGTGSFEVNVTGGAARTVSGVIDPDTLYQVRVEGPGNNYVLNTTHLKSDPSFTVENLVLEGNYSVTVTDGNGCTQNITVNLTTTAPVNLAASAIIEAAADCSANNFNDGNTGAGIRITSFDKGDGDVAGYPLWQRQTALDLNAVTISLNGFSSGVDLSTIGVILNGTTFDATSTVSVTSVQDVAASLANKINNTPNYTATLNGSSIQVKAQILDSASTLSAVPSGTTTVSATSALNISVSNITQISESSWVEVPGLAGQEVIQDLQAGFYRAIIRDGSGCGGALVQNTTQGGNIFKIDNPQGLQFKDIKFEEITCNNPESTLTFKLSNGTYELVPDPSAFEFSLNSVVLRSTVNGSISFSTGNTTPTGNTSPTSNTGSGTTATTVGNTYSPNLRTNLVTIESLPPDSYDLVVKNIQTQCLTVLNFTIEEASTIAYTGETTFEIGPCYETYQDQFFDGFLIEGGQPYQNINGENYYSLEWVFYPDDPTANVQTINSLSTNVNFAPYPGRYELTIRDSNGCEVLDENGVAVPIEFTFTKSLNELQVIGTGGVTGNDLATPVSCGANQQDGQINMDIVNADPNEPLPPYEITWEKQSSSQVIFEQRLLFEGVAAGDSLEVYSIQLNDQVFSYTTNDNNEPKATVVSELTREIDQSALYEAFVDPAGDEFEIIIRTLSLASLELDIVTENTRLAMVNSSSGSTAWIALNGTNGNPNYTGYLNLTGLEEGIYRYTINSIDVAQCTNNSEDQSIVGTIRVENESVLEIREGPIVDDYLCNGKPGTLFVDVFDGNTGPLNFKYDGKDVTHEQVGNGQYLINIDAPVESASLEIINTIDCSISRQINIGNGTPLFDFTSTNFQQAETFLAREDITFSDLSEGEYDTFEFIFGDGTQSELLERNSPQPILHEYAISGTYFVNLRIYNDLGCLEELSKKIKIGKGYSILSPNVFTPNGDEVNDTFRPVFNGLKEITLRIYDAQGGLVYEEIGAEGNDPSVNGISLRGWGGPTNSKASPYYIFTVNGITIDDEPVFRDGTFILLE